MWSYEGELYVWGLTRTVPTWCFVMEVVEPGLLIVKYRRDDPSTKFANIAVLDGADVKFIEQQPLGRFRTSRARSARCSRSTRRPAGMTPIIFWLRLRSACARTGAAGRCWLCPGIRISGSPPSSSRFIILWFHRRRTAL